MLSYDMHGSAYEACVWQDAVVARRMLHRFSLNPQDIIPRNSNIHMFLAEMTSSCTFAKQSADVNSCTGLRLVDVSSPWSCRSRRS